MPKPNSHELWQFGPERQRATNLPPITSLTHSRRLGCPHPTAPDLTSAFRLTAYGHVIPKQRIHEPLFPKGLLA